VAHFGREQVREELDLSAIVGVYKEERACHWSCRIEVGR